MTPTLPFLYLPDAVTLILLMLVMEVWRSVAVLHLRQELLIVRKEMLSCRLAGGIGQQDTGYAALRGLVDDSIRLAPRLSPARLLFILRLLRKARKLGHPVPASDPAQEVRQKIEAGASRAGREKLERLHMETSLSVGTFYLAGSLSGWVLAFAVLPVMIKRSIAHHAHHRTDSFFDMTERVLSRMGRNAQRTGLLTAAASEPLRREEKL